MTSLKILAVIALKIEALDGLSHLHPILVHFPIALIFAAVFTYFLGSLLKSDEFLVTAKWTLFLGTLGAVAAVGSGFLAEEAVSMTGEVSEIFEWHERMAFVTLLLALTACAWGFLAKVYFPGKGKKAFFLLLVILGFCLMMTGYLGGQLVYTHGVGVQAGRGDPVHTASGD